MLPMMGSGKAYATEVGEVMRVPLAHGSSLTLNTDSRVRVTGRENKQVVRVERGEVFFSITPTASARTEIHVGDTVLKPSVATFAVRRFDRQQAEIIVQKGQVNVGQDVGLASNAKARVSGGVSKIQNLGSGEVDRSLMWLQGKLVFEGQSLAEAAQDFARYGSPRIEVLDPVLAKEPVVGLFASNDPQGFAEAVAVSLGARVEARGGRLIIVR